MKISDCLVLLAALLICRIVINTAASSQLRRYCETQMYAVYMFGSCWVRQESTKKFDDWKTSCIMGSMKGALAVTPDQAMLPRLCAGLGIPNSGNSYFAGHYQLPTATNHQEGKTWIDSRTNQEWPMTAETYAQPNYWFLGSLGAYWRGIVCYIGKMDEDNVANANRAICQFKDQEIRYTLVAAGARGTSGVQQDYNGVNVMVKCSRICTEMLVCYSYSYNIPSQICRVHWKIANLTMTTIAESGWSYYGIMED